MSRHRRQQRKRMRRKYLASRPKRGDILFQDDEETVVAWPGVCRFTKPLVEGTIDDIRFVPEYDARGSLFVPLQLDLIDDEFELTDIEP